MNKTDITLKSVYLARKRIAPVIRKTPLIPFPDQKQENPVYLKLENLQETGSFKLRGAANALLGLPPDRKEKGVLAFSTGNHGRAVAWMAGRMGISCTICLSRRVPSYRVKVMEQFGAKVVQEGVSQDQAYEVALKLERDQGLTLIKPFDDPKIISGQGTMGLEILEEIPQIDTLVVPVSGGGLAAGVARVLKAADPAIRVIGVSMEVAPAMYHSIKAGKPVEIEEKDSLADALLGGIGLDNQYTYPMVERYLDRIDLVSENEIEEGMIFAHDTLGILIEGAAAVTLAWLLKNPDAGKSVVGILSGGNVDTDLLFDILSRHKK
ncbi:threonine ammonia-lyase [Desulfospira joergensenii]|uniref:threonine ammonia-lyase n=1 Tax=Desulfospira joergensenii TaxID=53329 RepID=UPI0003B41158|nr:pyridoxal-phosphate dependent enzyme [Desulfospira joergensenii]